MGVILDLALIAIVAYCGWRGFRTGIINGICGVVAVVIAIYGAGLVASVYSTEFVGMLRPFVSGVADNAENNLTAYALGKADPDFEPVAPVTEAELDDNYAMSHAILRQLRFTEAASKELAAKTAERVAADELRITDAMTEVACERVCFVALFAIGFLMISIIFTVIGNVFDLAFGIPGHELINHITGAVFGVAQGILFVVVLTCLARYVGLVLSEDTIASTWLLEKCITDNALAGMLGI